MDALPHKFLIMKAKRFAPLRASLSGDLFALNADAHSSFSHVVRKRGAVTAIRLALKPVEARHRAMAEGNVLRKSAQFAAFRRPWLRRAYAHIKAKHAEFAELLIEDTLARMQDPVCLVQNGFNVPDSVLKEVAPPHRRVFLENGYFKGTLQADPKGINDDNGLPRDPEFFRSYQPDARPLDLVLNTRKPKHAAQKKADLPKGYVFVPFQVESDSQITQHSPWITDMHHLYDVILTAVTQHPDLHVVIKEHPNQRRVLHGSVPEHPRIVFQNGCSTEDLILGAAAVLTVNSTVGVEALALGRPVITLGRACYNIDGLVHHAPGPEALESLLARPQELLHDADLTHRFLHFLTYEFLTPEAGHPPGSTTKDHFEALTRRDFTACVPKAPRSGAARRRA